MKFYCLGTGSRGNSYYINTGKIVFGLDAGLPLEQTKQFFAAHNMPLFDSTYYPKFYCVTHEHGDHLSHVKHVAQTFNSKIYLCDKITEKKHETPVVFLKPLPHKKNFLYIKEHDIYMYAFPIPHDVPNLAFQLQIPNPEYDSSIPNSKKYKTVVYITDVGNNRTLPREFYDLKILKEEKRKVPVTVDLLLMECNYSEERMEQTKLVRNQRVKGELGHLSNVDSANYLFELGILTQTKIVLIHASGDNLNPEKDYQVFDKIHAKELLIAKPHLEVEF